MVVEDVVYIIRSNAIDVMYELPVKTHIISLHITARLNNHGKKEIENVQSAARLASARDVIRPRARARQNQTENYTNT